MTGTNGRYHGRGSRETHHATVQMAAEDKGGENGMTHTPDPSLLAYGHEYEPVVEDVAFYLSESAGTRYVEKWDSAVTAVRNMICLENDWNGMGALAPGIGAIEAAGRLIQFYRHCGSPGPDRVIASPMGTLVFEWLQSLGNLTEVEVTNSDICEWVEYRDGKIQERRVLSAARPADRCSRRDRRLVFSGYGEGCGLRHGDVSREGNIMSEETVEQQLAEIERIANGGPDGMDAVNRFARLDRRRMELELEAEEIKKDCDDLQPAVLEWFTQQGIENIRTDRCLVHIVKTWKGYAKPGYNSEDVCRALQYTGHSDAVNTLSYHWKRMSSILKEYDDRDEELPEDLAAVLDAREEFKVQTRK